jgi:pimeloyl-ACP methyl ester carboxylesterase
MEKPVTFACKGQQIVGMLHLPEGQGKFPAALLLHGFTGTKSEAHRLFVKLSRKLAAHGIASLRFDFRGCGDSAGNFEDHTIRSQIADGSEALKFLVRHKRIDACRLALIGLSMGGAVAAHVDGREKDRIKSLVLLAPVAEGAGILDDLSTPEAVSSLAQTGITDYGGNLVGVAFIRQFAEMKPVRELARSASPVLIVHGSKDETVPVAHADLYERAAHAAKRVVKKVIIPGADHTFNKHVWEQRVITETVDWLGETL